MGLSLAKCFVAGVEVLQKGSNTQYIGAYFEVAGTSDKNATPSAPLSHQPQSPRTPIPKG